MRGTEQVGRYDVPCLRPEEVLTHLERLAVNGSLTWVFTFRLKELLGLIGFWDGVLAGTIDLWGEDYGRPRERSNGGRKKWAGYLVLENPPSIVCAKFGRRGGAVRLIDLANYGLADFRQLAEDYDKGPPCWEGDLIEWGTVHELAANWAYAAESWLLEAWQALHDGGYGSWQSTISSQAQYTFRRRFMTHDVLVHNNREAKELERKCLYAGRCETTFLGVLRSNESMYPLASGVEIRDREIVVDGPIYHLDVNSLYPAVACNAQIPARLESRLGEVSPDLLPKLAKNYAVIADVEIDTDVPIAPLRLKNRRIEGGIHDGLLVCPGPKDGRTEVIWPCGRFRTQLCWPELAMVYGFGKCHRVYDAAIYHTDDVFACYVQAMYVRRQAAKASGKRGLENFYKLMLNSLFGKFAQHQKAWRPVPDCPADEPFDQWHQINRETLEIETWRSVAWRVEKLVTLGEHPQSCPVITAWVNSLGRRRLVELIAVAHTAHVYYYDTDSLWVNKFGLANLQAAGEVSPFELGRLKIVGEHRRVELRGIKHYVADGWRVCAGLEPGQEPGIDGRFSVTLPVPMGIDVAVGQAPQAARFTTAVRLPSQYKHGKVQPNGQVLPWKLSGQDTWTGGQG